MHGRTSDPAVDVNRDAEEPRAAVRAGKSIFFEIKEKKIELRSRNGRRRGNRSNVSISKMLRKAFAPAPGWGPREVQQRKDWRIFKEGRARAREKRVQPVWKQTLYVLLNKEPK